jgi:formate hydrogenlyase subunit 6/NADH:ubiquinone oxidoreductase subunit I
MNKCLESCTGTAIIEWEQMILAEVPKEERVDYVIKYGHILRKQYCSEVCPVARFRRKYEKHSK